MLRLLEMLLDPNFGIRSSDVNTGFNNVENKPIGNEIALHFLSTAATTFKMRKLFYMMLRQLIKKNMPKTA